LEKATDMTDLQSTITCPQCRHRETETMPTDACQFFYAGPGFWLSREPVEA
jgi:hypothetical protein